MTTNNSIRIIFAAVMLAGGGVSCGVSQSKPDNKNPEAAVAANAVKTFALKKDVFSASLRIPGELQAFQQVDLYAKVNSFVKKLYVDVGSNVSAGQLLATMEAPELNAQLAGAESRLRQRYHVATVHQGSQFAATSRASLRDTGSPEK